MKEWWTPQDIAKANELLDLGFTSFNTTGNTVYGTMRVGVTWPSPEGIAMPREVDVWGYLGDGHVLGDTMYIAARNAGTLFEDNWPDGLRSREDIIIFAIKLLADLWREYGYEPPR